MRVVGGEKDARFMWNLIWRTDCSQEIWNK